MKRISLICGLAALACSCGPKGFVVDGTLANAEGGKVLLLYQNNKGEEIPVDSAVVENGKFRLEGRVETPEMHRLTVNLNPAGTPDEETDYGKIFSERFYLENSPITFVADANTMQSYFWNPDRKTVPPTIEGSAEQDKAELLTERQREVNERLNALSRRMTEEYYGPMFDSGEHVVPAVGAEIAAEEIEASKERREITLAFVRQFPDAAVSFDQVSYLFGDGSVSPFTAAQIDEFMAILEPAWKGTAKFEWLKGQAEKAKQLAVGEKFIDCEFYNREGEKVKLSSVIPEGKICMLEFWASWCGPCRGEIPHLKHVRERYPDFDIVSVSIDESDADWKKALDEEKMDWVQLRDVGMMDGNAMKRYNVFGVPCCIILDREGRFYKTDMRGAYLDAFLVETYGR
ncbi:DUF4369 domain-containing protein [Alistipes sp.]|uniref:DUF4369 domain-containing protein n=1 Tax=Alistipes sp. TaxID=1872444 RepID=UPI003AEF9F09